MLRIVNRRERFVRDAQLYVTIIVLHACHRSGEGISGWPCWRQAKPRGGDNLLWEMFDRLPYAIRKGHHGADASVTCRYEASLWESLVVAGSRLLRDRSARHAGTAALAERAAQR